MKLDDKFIKQEHAKLYQSDLFFEGEERSDKSFILPTAGGELYFEQYEYHLGELKSALHRFEVVAVNPGERQRKIKKVSSEGDASSVFRKWLTTNKEYSIPANSSIGLSISMDCSEQIPGYYREQLYFVTDDDYPQSLVVHWAIDRSGRILNIKNDNQKSHSVEVDIAAGKTTDKAKDLGKIYSQSGASYFCYAPTARWVYLVEGSNERKHLMSRGKNGMFRYFTRKASSFGHFYYVDDGGFVVNSHSERTLHYNHSLQPCELPGSTQDRLFIKIKKNKKSRLKVESLPDWLELDSQSTSSTSLSLNTRLRAAEAVYGLNSGKILLSSKKKNIEIDVSCELYPDAMVPLSLDEEVDLIAHHVDANDILHGSIPLKVIGAGKLSVSLGEPAVEHAGTIEDYNEEQSRIINYPILINLRTLSIDKIEKFQLRIFLGSMHGEKYVFSTILKIREPNWQRTIGDTIGYLSLYRGSERTVKFAYTFHELQRIEKFELAATATDNGYIHKYLEDESTLLICHRDAPDSPFIELKYEGENRFSLQVLTDSIARTHNFSIPLEFQIFTDKSEFSDRILLMGEVLVAELKVGINHRKSIKKQYYSNGELILTNLSDNDLCIFSYYSETGQIRLYDDEDEVHLPLIIEAKKKHKLAYSHRQNDRLYFNINNVNEVGIDLDVPD